VPESGLGNSERVDDIIQSLVQSVGRLRSISAPIGSPPTAETLSLTEKRLSNIAHLHCRIIALTGAHFAHVCLIRKFVPLATVARGPISAK
jgi:hypothetical protein